VTDDLDLPRTNADDAMTKSKKEKLENFSNILDYPVTGPADWESCSTARFGQACYAGSYGMGHRSYGVKPTRLTSVVVCMSADHSRAKNDAYVTA
jgi:hypothetical protein